MKTMLNGMDHHSDWLIVSGIVLMILIAIGFKECTIDTYPDGRIRVRLFVAVPQEKETAHVRH